MFVLLNGECGNLTGAPNKAGFAGGRSARAAAVGFERGEKLLSRRKDSGAAKDKEAEQGGLIGEAVQGMLIVFSREHQRDDITELDIEGCTDFIQHAGEWSVGGNQFEQTAFAD